MSKITEDLVAILRQDTGLPEARCVQIAERIERNMIPYTNARKAIDMSGYAVHHINGKPWDNRLDNLTLVRKEES